MKVLPRTLLLLLTSSLLCASALPLHAESPTAALLTEAQAAYQRGDLEAAKRSFEIVSQIEPGNATARRFLTLIKAQAAKATGPTGAQPLQKQIATVMLHQVQFRDASLGSALEAIKVLTAKATDGKVNLSFVFQVPEETLQAKNITLALNDVPLSAVLRYVGELGDVSFGSDPYAIVVRPRATAVAK